jgi:Response regulators consisting of a CheY-like receiver domain and a winged-helix DNA-binding domain
MKKIDLSKNEYKLLQRLLRDQGKIVTREQLLNFMWDDERFVDDNTLTVNINRLRTKISQFGLENYIVTKVGQGYIIP